MPLLFYLCIAALTLLSPFSRTVAKVKVLTINRHILFMNIWCVCWPRQMYVFLILRATFSSHSCPSYSNQYEFNNRWQMWPNSRAVPSTRVARAYSSSKKSSSFIFELEYSIFFYKRQTAIKTGKPLAQTFVTQLRDKFSLAWANQFRDCPGHTVGYPGNDYNELA